jgi:hypothetical protein
VKTLLRCLLGGVLVTVVCLPSEAAAHDDPIVTVRVLCNGFNVLDMDAVLGEIADSATLRVDRPVHGLGQIEQWVQEQMNDDLRIEIVDIGTPQKLPDGYTLTWTGRFSRQDWRNQGIQSREMSNLVVIHNGRITEWTAQLASGETTGAPPASAAHITVVDPARADLNRMPEFFGIPLSLLVAVTVAIAGAAVIVLLSMRG